MQVRLNSFLFLFLGFMPSLVLAQAGHYWHQRYLQQDVEAVMNADARRDHLSIKPLALRDIPDLALSSDTSLILHNTVPNLWEKPGDKNWKFSVSPLLRASAGYSSDENGVFTTAPGLATHIRYGNEWSFYGDLFVGGEKLPGYVQNFQDSTGVLPSLGENRANTGNSSFFIPTLRLAYAPIDYFQFELGYGTNFIGQGYRSMFLSDAHYNYPYLKIATDVWNIKYINIYSALKGTNLSQSSPTDFQNKFSTTHYLSWAVSPRFNFGLFETIVWQGQDTLSDRGFDVNYLNPIIFYRPVEYSVGSPDNALLGLDLSFKATKKLTFYGQLLFDEFLLSEFRDGRGWWANKWGAQLGVKSYGLFAEGLNLRAEFNVARPFTYTHGSVLQNFGHYNQPLAHQLGTNFYEALASAYFEKGNYYGGFFGMYARYGRDPEGLNLGGDIYKSYVNPTEIYGNKIGQGIKSHLYFQRLTAGIILNRNINLRLGLNYTYRREDEENSGVNNEHIFGVTIATDIYNQNRVF